MKKFLTFLLAALLCVCCVGMVACKGTPQDPEVHGVYKTYSLTANGETYNIGDTLPGGGMFGPNDMQLTQEVMTIELKEDGTYVMTELGYDLGGGVWTQEEDAIRLEISGGATVDAPLNGEYLTLDYSGAIFILKKIAATN